MLKIALLFAFGYLLGAIPTGYLVGRLKGIDIRQHGSGNPGTANVYRTLGKWPGIITFLVDFLKGILPVWISLYLYPTKPMITILTGALAIIGHIWTIFLNFKGGKGVATSAGVFMAILPLPTLGAFIAFAIAVWLTGHISVGSMTASVILPILCFILSAPKVFTIMALAVCTLIFYTHIPNIKRILNGKELSFKYEGKRKNYEK